MDARLSESLSRLRLRLSCARVYARVSSACGAHDTRPDTPCSHRARFLYCARARSQRCPRDTYVRGVRDTHEISSDVGEIQRESITITRYSSHMPPVCRARQTFFRLQVEQVLVGFGGTGASVLRTDRLTLYMLFPQVQPVLERRGRGSAPLYVSPRVESAVRAPRRVRGSVICGDLGGYPPFT